MLRCARCDGDMSHTILIPAPWDDLPCILPCTWTRLANWRACPQIVPWCKFGHFAFCDMPSVASELQQHVHCILQHLVEEEVTNMSPTTCFPDRQGLMAMQGKLYASKSLYTQVTHRHNAGCCGESPLANFGIGVSFADSVTMWVIMMFAGM